MLTRDFLLAGKAIFTVQSKTGERYTYRITHKPARDGWKDAYFASLLTGPSNTDDYTYLGLVITETLTVRLTRASHYAEDSTPVKVLRWFLTLVHGGKPLPEGYSANHAGMCGRCGRLLTVPESVEEGIGPICRGKLGLPPLERNGKPITAAMERAANKAAKQDEEEEGDALEEDVSEVSSGAHVNGLTPHRDAEGEITHWTGTRRGRKVTVFND